MDFNLTRLREYLPTELPSLPSWPSNHSSMNPDSDAYTPPPRQPAPPTSTTTNSKAPLRSPRPSPIAHLEPAPIPPGPKTNLDLLNECDNFPHYATAPARFFAHINTYYALYVHALPEVELGYILPSIAEVFKGLPDWKIDTEERSLTLISGSTEAERTKVVGATTRAMRATGHFRVLEKWRDELYPVYGPGGEVLFSIERSASPLFGVVTYGCHLTAYVPPTSTSTGEEQEMRIWVPRRAATKQTYGGMLDNTVAGGLSTGETPLTCITREAAEEASLPPSLVTSRVRAVGAVSYFHIRDARAGGETGLLQPEIQYVYDLQLEDGEEPKPSDGEVEGFELMGVAEVRERMRAGEFKPNCALVLLDFLVRHGVLTAEEEGEEGGFLEVVGRLHRRLEFPVR